MMDTLLTAIAPTSWPDAVSTIVGYAAAVIMFYLALKAL